MKRKLLLALTLLFSLTAAKNGSYHQEADGDSSIDIKLADKKGEYVMPSNSSRSTKNEIIIEKFLDNMLNSDEYFNKIDTIQDKLNYLNYLFYNKTNTIIKYLSNIYKIVQTSPVHVMESAVQSLKDDLNKVKNIITQRQLAVLPMRRGIQFFLHQLSYNNNKDNVLAFPYP